MLFCFRNNVLGEATSAKQIGRADPRLGPKRKACRPTAVRLFAFLLEHRPAGFAEIRFLPSQAGGDRPDVGNLPRAEAVDVGRAGPLLFGGCEFGVRQAGCEPAEKQAERQCAMSAFRARR